MRAVAYCRWLFARGNRRSLPSSPGGNSPFPNGAGRHAQHMTDQLIEKLGQPRFTWASRSSIKASDTGKRNTAALQAAANRDFAPLTTFASN
jgi:fido (protein-threonine AMPylation protein)